MENLTVFVCVKLLSRPDPAFSRIQQEGPDPTSKPDPTRRSGFTKYLGPDPTRRSGSDKKVRI